MLRAPDSGKRRTQFLGSLTAALVLTSGSLQAAQGTYTVQQGDTLFGIASRHEVTVDGLLQANRLAHTAPLQIGQKLVIPDRPSSAAKVPAATAVGPTYQVQAGDNLYRIAERFHVTVDDLTVLNNLSAKSILQIGQTLQLPTGALPPALQVSPPTAPVAGLQPTAAAGSASFTALPAVGSSSVVRPSGAAVAAAALPAVQPPGAVGSQPAPAAMPAAPEPQAAALVSTLPRPSLPAATPSAVWVNESRIHLRSAASTTSDSLGLVSYGTKLPVTGKDGSWWRVSTSSGRSAWVAGWVVSTRPLSAPLPALPAPSTSGGVVCSGYALEARVTLRRDAAADSEPVTAVVRGTKLEVLRVDGGWLQVRVGDSTGWVPCSLVRLPAAGTGSTPASSGSGDGSALARTALSYVGTPYSRGGTSRGGVDCSGLVYAVCRAHGIRLPRTSSDMYGHGQKVARGNLQAGDLVFFKNTYRSGISHVGVFVGNNRFVHAVRPGRGVQVSSLGEAYYAGRYAGAFRVAR
ncbi:MAG: LysM peptidoglycan-binding domain-containing protein [Fimbriimonadaceae bacterium]|nr:LysM peptidoglycan-binding domain-containing protein [Fimbriimonadaceae bacterium]